jgi:hypothetical protein
MPFQPGNKYGGPKPNSGRPRKKEIEAKQTAAEVVRRVLELNAERISTRYVERILGEAGDKVLTHAIDKLLPDEQPQFQAPIFNITFATYQHHNSSQLQAQDISATVLASDGQDGEAGRKSLAPPQRQGQDGLKFHDFSDVPGE